MAKKKVLKDFSTSASQKTNVSHAPKKKTLKKKSKSGLSLELLSMMESMSEAKSKGESKSIDEETAADTLIDIDDLTDGDISSDSDSDTENTDDLGKQKKHKFDAEANGRTVFVGNVAIDSGKRKLISLFSQYGKVEAIRFRSAAPARPEVSKKEAVIKHNVHPSRNSVNAYVRFESKDMMEAALDANGTVLLGNHLRVDRASQQDEHDRKYAVFVGNLPFECREETLYQHFEDCGTIDSVRIIRDKKFSSGKGFGYVNFKSSDAVEFALRLNGKIFRNRELRVQRCVKKVKQEKDKKKKGSLLHEGQSIGFMKRKGHQKMTLQFMKTQKNNSKGNAVNKKRSQLNQGKFSGMEMMDTENFKKIKKKRQKPTKDQMKKAFLSYHLSGPKITKKKKK